MCNLRLTNSAQNSSKKIISSNQLSLTQTVYKPIACSIGMQCATGTQSAQSELNKIALLRRLDLLRKHGTVGQQYSRS